MKKILLFSMLLLAIVLTGCGSNTNNQNSGGNDEPVLAGKRLVCSQKVQTVDVNMIADFKENELTYLGLKYEMDLSGYTDVQIKAIGEQDMCSTVKKSMSSYTDAFTNCKQKLENKTLLITADFDLDKLVGADISKNTSIDVAKASLEKQNYSCTISDK